MEDKYYLDDEGLAVLISSLSNAIASRTSGEIETENSGELKDAIDPTNFTTTHAVVEYLKNRKRIKVNQQSTKVIEPTDEEEEITSYDVKDNITEYNGEEEVQLKLELVTANDVRSLFEDFTTEEENPVDDDF